MSVSDPVLAAWFGVGNPNFAGVAVSEASALGISAVWRSVNLISGTLGTLPLRSLQDTDEGRERVKSIFDDPGRVVGIRPYRWKQTSIAHLALHGNIFWAHIRNGGGGLAGLMPIHPLSVAVDWERDPDGNLTGRKVFDTTLVDGTRHRYTEDTMTHVPGLCLDGLRGLSPITVARNSLGTAIAGDRAAAKMFSDGALISGMVTPEEDLEAGEAEKIRADLNRNVAGWENVGQVAVVNRRLRFTPWTMSAEDAQFLESRAFSVEEVARWYGVPPHLLMQTEKQTSWGMGVESQNRGLGRFTLVHYSAPVEEACSALLGPGRLVEFDYVGLERPTPAEEIRLLLEQVRGGLITVNEARKIRNLPPVDGGDSLAEPQGTASPPGADPSQGVPA
jgi:HK97 family phage portal protein